MQRLVGGWGSLADEAANAQQALQLLRSAASRGKPYHWGIVNLDMPGKTGLELAHDIQRNPSINAVRLVMLTSAGRHLDSKEAQQGGVSACLQKPVNPCLLHDCLVPLGNPSGRCVPEKSSPFGD